MRESGLLAEFETADALLRAVRELRHAGFKRMDAFTPFALDGLDEALGLKRSYVPAVVLLAAVAGAVTAYSIQWWTAAWDYPLNAGGRPAHAVPSFIPITFEGAVLASVCIGFAAFLWACRLPRPYHALFDVDGFERVSNDRFFLGIDAGEPMLDERTHGALLALGAVRVVRVEPRP